MGSAEVDGFADDARVGGELVTPVCFGEQCDWMQTRPCFLCSEQAAQDRFHAEDLEEVAHHHDAGGRLRIAVAGETEIVGRGEGFVAADILIDAAYGAELFKRISRVSGAGEAARPGRRGDPYEFVGFREWKRPKEERIRHAEDGDVGSDRERKDENAYGCEAWIVAQSADSVAEIPE